MQIKFKTQQYISMQNHKLPYHIKSNARYTIPKSSQKYIIMQLFKTFPNYLNSIKSPLHAMHSK